jgi:hypothetical protein
MNSPLPETGKDIYQQVKGKPYPHIGWWSKPESLDMDIFDIRPKSGMEEVYRNVMKNPEAHAVLLTNRQYKLGDEVKKVLDSHNMTFEHYSYKHNDHEKGDRMLEIMKKYYPGVKNIVFYDDDDSHFNLIKNKPEMFKDYNIKLYHVNGDYIQKHLDNAEMVLAGKDYNLKTVKISSDLDYLDQSDKIK